MGRWEERAGQESSSIQALAGTSGCRRRSSRSKALASTTVEFIAVELAGGISSSHYAGSGLCAVEQSIALAFSGNKWVKADQ